MTQQWTHAPVLLRETVDLLAVRPDGVYLDGTLGLGGHSGAILERTAPAGRVIGIDLDPNAVAMAREKLKTFGARFTAVEGSYTDAVRLLAVCGFAKADGALFDLGFSSYQMDDPSRGFSFNSPARLDMRFGASRLTAHDIVNTWPAEELARIIYKYGEERFSRQIAQAILRARQKAPIDTNVQLRNVIEGVCRYGGKIHPATRTFQALRIVVNDELGNVEKILKALPALINNGGRAAFITFHSLEDRLVKHGLRALQEGGGWTVLTKKPVAPAESECAENPRSRSAKLRVIERAA